MENKEPLVSWLAIENLTDIKILVEEALNKGLWFYKTINGIGVWMSPNEYKSKILKNNKLWNVNGWILRNPKERVHELKFTMNIVRDEIESIERELKNN